MSGIHRGRGVSSVLTRLLAHELHLSLDLGAFLLHLPKKVLALLATAGVCSVAPGQRGRSRRSLEHILRRKRVCAGVWRSPCTNSRTRELGSMLVSPRNHWKKNMYLCIQTPPSKLLSPRMSTFVSQRARTSNVEVEAPLPLPAPATILPIIIPTALPS